MQCYKIIINLYRIVSVILLMFLTFMYVQYKDKECTKVEKIVNPNYVFLGDSITKAYDLKKHYKGYPVVNSGVNGNKTKCILEDLENRVFVYNPSKVILLVGINDLNTYETVDETFDGITKISKEIKKRIPNVQLYIQSIYPVNKKYVDPVTEEKLNEINGKIKKLCDEELCEYIDVYSQLLDENNKLNLDYSNDGLHLNEEGYKIVTKKIKESILEE